MNLNEVDIKGRKIKEGQRVKLYQRPLSFFTFYTCKNEKDLKENECFIKAVFERNDMYPKGIYTLKHWKNDEYIVAFNGKPFGVQIGNDEIISKTVFPFMMESERDISEMNIKKGEKVLCIAGEGFVAGIFHYEPYNLKILGEKNENHYR